jgi:RNA polymerase sigma factor (sigma-70 family)
VAQADQRTLLVAYLEDGDVRARDRLVEELMPLVRSLANRYAGRGEPTEDLVQVGAIGLVKAIDRFELEKGVELSTYAVPTIVGEIRRHFRDRTWAVHVPRRLKELSMRLARTRDELSAELGRSPTVAELAAAVGVDEEEAIDALEASKAYASRSLDQPYDEGSRADCRGWRTRSAGTPPSSAAPSCGRDSTRSTSGSGGSSCSASCGGCRSRRSPRRSGSRRCTSRGSCGNRSM